LSVKTLKSSILQPALKLGMEKPTHLQSKPPQGPAAINQPETYSKSGNDIKAMYSATKFKALAISLARLCPQEKREA
jgi:hypothetical protein